MNGLIKIALSLSIVCICLFGNVLNSHSGYFYELHAAILSVEWMLLVAITIWCSCFIFLTFIQNDWPLIGLLLIAIAAYSLSSSTTTSRVTDVITLVAGVTLGRGARFFVGSEMAGFISKTECKSTTSYLEFYFLGGLVILLAFAAWWQLTPTGVYHGPRWMGLLDNPNIYGMLMGSGLTLVIGLLPQIAKEECRLKKWQIALYFVAAGMMAVGLVMSYSRGAWVGTLVGMVYLAWTYRKLKWRFVLPVVLIIAAVAIFFWHGTADTDAWYLKRLDLGRPSAQHRVSAWRGALQIIRDHPLGVGWNRAVSVYDKNYLHPEGSAAALATNSYLMLGTELGVPGLLCFVAYVGLQLKGGKRKTDGETHNPEFGMQTACRAGSLILVVSFWFDGGLFDLPTASLFWILLELGAVRQSESPLSGALKSRLSALSTFWW